MLHDNMDRTYDHSLNRRLTKKCYNLQIELVREKWGIYLRGQSGLKSGVTVSCPVNAPAISNASSASLYLPKLLRASPLPSHATARFGFISIALLKATMASSYFPKPLRASPLLYHAPSASSGFISMALSKAVMASSYLFNR